MQATVLGGNLRRDLFRLGVVPCAVVAIALTAWFTHNRLDMLEGAFNAEGEAVARQVAAMSDLSLYAGDLPALQNVANAALRGGQVTRVEISNSAGVFVTAGPRTVPASRQRIFSATVTLREASRASAFAPPGSTAGGDAPIGQVLTFRDTTAHARERIRSLMASIGIAAFTLLLAWVWVRHTARTVAQPLRRISRTVAALEAGQFDARCEIVGRAAPRPARDPGPGQPTRASHELANLAHDINRLAERLQRHRQQSDEKVRDATAVALQRMAEAEQAALSRARFLAAASHDLRQPLHAMGLFVDGLLTTATPAQRPAMLRLQEGADFMGVLLDDLLEISRLDAQVLTPSIAGVSLQLLFDQLNAQQAARAVAARVRLVWKDQGLAVRTDMALLARIIGNLVSNAIHHSSPDGCVLVAARRQADGRVRIEVRDNGVGIAPIHQGRIFEEFYQVANTERDRRQGFGLGLAICARVAALLGTRISLRSALQKGSRFSLNLPAADPREVLPPAPQPIAPASLAGLRCLVVDDDPAILDGSRGLLVQWGCVVDCLQSGAQALALMGQEGRRYDVILCDLQLADDEDGMQVIEEARRLQGDVLTVLISGATGPEVLQRLRQRGVLLLTKPVAPAKLRALLSTRARRG